MAREKEEGRMKRSADMLTFLKAKHEEKFSVSLEKAKAEKLAQKNALIKEMHAAGFSKEEILEQLKGI